MAEQNDNKILKQIKPSRVIIPMIIGLGVVFYMIYNEFDSSKFSALSVGYYSILWIAISILMMLTRDIGYMVRLKILAGKELKWKSVINIILLWEFTSAVTPSAIGGTSVAVYFIHKEGVSVGKSTAIVMATSILDELYFILMFPLMIFLVTTQDLFQVGNEIGTEGFANRYFYFAVIGYSIKFLFLASIIYGLFFNPHSIKNLLIYIFKLRFLKRWRKSVEKVGDDMVIASAELKTRGFWFWTKAFIATFFSWSARYLVLNFLILALFASSNYVQSDYLNGIGDQFLLFARQLVMWIMMLIMPSPGGSGFVETIFGDYMAEFIPLGFVALMALLWRFITYYPYLIIGAFVLPKWVKKIIQK
jgi:uncharacterized protein (TIRG00374 family)